MTSPLNEIEIGVTVNDDTAPGFASIYARAMAFRAAMQGQGGTGTAGPELGLGAWARQAAIIGATSGAGSAGRDMRLMLAQLRQGGAAHQDLLLTVRQLNSELSRTPASQGGTAAGAAAAAGIAGAVAAALTSAQNAAQTQPPLAPAAAAAIAAAVAARQQGGGVAAAAVAARLAGAAAGGQYPGPASSAAAAAAGAAGGRRGFGGGFGGFLGGLAAAQPIPLFGGAFGTTGIFASIGAVHLLGEAVIETAGTLVPAALAFAAFGAAAAGPVTDIYTRMQNLHTVVTATGQSLYPFGNQLSRIQDAVRPQVMLLFGDALTIAGAKTGAFTRLAEQGGTALDQLGARFTFAVTHGSGFSAFLANSGQDLLGWGNLVGNLGGILGNFLKQLPGYARYLLGFADTVTHVAETITGSGVGQGIIGAGLAAHGALIYMGLGVTAAAAAFRGGLTLLGNWSERAAAAMATTRLFGGRLVSASGALMGFSAGAAEAAALPWGWIMIAAGAVAFLTYKLVTLKDATQLWVSSLQSALGSSSAGGGPGGGFMALAVAQAQVVARIAQTQQALLAAQRTGRTLALGPDPSAHAAAIAQAGGIITGAQKQISELTAANRQLSDQTALYTYRLGRLGVMYGGVTAAQGLLTAAGIKMSQMLDTTQWPQILQQVQAVINAYTAMGQRNGVLGADLNALTIAGSDQVKAMTQLNTAWDTTFGIVSGGQTSFITFEQALQGLPALAKAAGASMTGLNAPSLALRSGWQGAYQDAVKLADAARMMQAGGATNLPLTRALRDMVAGLMPLGKESAATRAELVALAGQVQPSVRNWQDLVKWLGNTTGAQRNLDKIMAQSGTDIQNLAKDAANLAGIMQGQITAAFSRSKLQSSGFNAALSNLTDVMKTNAKTSPVVATAATALYGVLVNKLGYGAKTAAALIDTLTGVIIKIPKNTTAHVGVSGVGAAMSQLSAYEALLSRASGVYQAQVNAGVGVLQHSPSGAHPLVPRPPGHQSGVPGGWHGSPGAHVHIRLSADPSMSGDLAAAVLKCVRYEVIDGGGDVQVVLGTGTS